MLVMPKRPKVVPIPTPERTNSDERRLIAHDAISRRYIFAIGPRRFAFDWTSRITRLPPDTGEQPAPVVLFPSQEKPGRTSK